jgi:hypothetical protein
MGIAPVRPAIIATRSTFEVIKFTVGKDLI